MTVNKVRRRGSFAPLSAHAYKDDALAEAGEAAELLYYRALSFAADVLQDGLVTHSQLTRLVGHGMRDAKKRAERLVHMGLWIKDDKGYRIRSWLNWNRSVEEIKHLQRKDAGRKVDPDPDPDGGGELPESDSDRTPNGIQSESDREVPDTAAESSAHIHSHSHSHSQSQSQSQSQITTARGADARAARETFAEFWAAYPRKTGKGAAEKAWAKAVKALDPTVVIDGARRYAEIRRGQDPQFTPHPATWLNAKRWEDEPEQPPLRLVSNGHTPYRNPTDQSVYDEEL